MRKYNVWIFNINHKQMELYNVFEHYDFNERVDKLIPICHTKAELSEAVRRQARYFFWGKAEWEVILGPWVGSRDRKSVEIKLDVFDQLDANWEMFIDYIWNNRNEEEYL